MANLLNAISSGIHKDLRPIFASYFKNLLFLSLLRVDPSRFLWIIQILEIEGTRPYDARVWPDGDAGIGALAGGRLVAAGGPVGRAMRVCDESDAYCVAPELNARPACRYDRAVLHPSSAPTDEVAPDRVPRTSPRPRPTPRGPVRPRPTEIVPRPRASQRPCPHPCPAHGRCSSSMSLWPVPELRLSVSPMWPCHVRRGRRGPGLTRCQTVHRESSYFQLRRALPPSLGGFREIHRRNGFLSPV